jgi:hypothetical protein
MVAAEDIPALTKVYKLRNSLAHNLEFRLSDSDEHDLYGKLSPRQLQFVDDLRNQLATLSDVLVRLRLDLLGLILSLGRPTEPGERSTRLAPLLRACRVKICSA